MRGRDEPVAEAVDPLVVVAVHLELARPDQAGQARALVDRDLVHREHPASDAETLGAERLGQVLVQRAAAGDVHELKPAADREHGHPPLLGAAEEGELPRVAVGTWRIGERMPLRSVQLRLHIEATREDEPVEALEHGVGGGIRVRLRRQQHRHAARRRHRVEVLLGKERCAHVPHPCFACSR